MSLVKLQDFIVVPKDLQPKFIYRVTNSYFDSTLANETIANYQLATEVSVSNQMVDMISEIADGMKLDKVPAYIIKKNNIPIDIDYYMHDVILAMEYMKLSYHLDCDGIFHNLPFREVW